MLNSALKFKRTNEQQRQILGTKNIGATSSAQMCSTLALLPRCSDMVNIGATSTLLRHGQHWRYFHAAQIWSTLALLPRCSDVLNIGATSSANMCSTLALLPLLRCAQLALLPLLRCAQHWRYFHAAQTWSTLALLPLLR